MKVAGNKFTPEELKLHYADCMLWVYDVLVGACRDSGIEIELEQLKQVEWANWLGYLNYGLNPWNPHNSEDLDYGQRPDLN